jgi:hypothetical protein
VVTFYVTDAKGKPDPTPPSVTIVVTHGANQAPTARLSLAPATGNAPLVVSMSGSGSSDPDGSIASYRFAFGDGATLGPGTTQSTSHTYVAGSWSAQLTVTDNRGATQTITAPIIVAPVSAGPNLVSNPSAEVDLQGWAGYGGGTLQRRPGGFDKAYAMWIVGPSSNVTFGLNDSPNWIAKVPASNVGVPYRFSAWVRSPSSAGRAKLQVREWSGSLQVGNAQSALSTLSPVWQPLSVDYAPHGANSALDFQVLDVPAAPAETLIVDNVAIKLAGATTGVEAPASIALGAVLIPNPMTGGSQIELTLPRSGPAVVQILDLAGRVMRTLLDTHELEAGVHRIEFDGAAANGVRLESGIYFYRVRAGSGTVTHRFAIMR